MKRFHIIVLTLFASALFINDAKSFSVSPIGFKSTIEPGEKQVLNIVVTNNEKGSHRYSVNINSIRNTEEGKRYYEAGGDPAEFWAKANPQTFNLSPNESRTVAITIDVPIGAVPGSHPLAFLVASENLTRGEIGLTARSAIPVNLIVAGEVTERLVLKKFSSDENIIGKNIWPFKIELFNDGTMEVRANGWIQIKNSFGKEVLSRPIVLGNVIYTQSVRRIEERVEVSPGLWPGKYTVKLAVQFGDSKTTISAETIVWYFPVWFAGVLLSLVFILIIWLWRRRKVCP